MIKLKDSRETIGAGLRLLLNAANIKNCGLVLKLTRYRVSRTLEASLQLSFTFLVKSTTPNSVILSLVSSKFAIFLLFKGYRLIPNQL